MLNAFTVLANTGIESFTAYSEADSMVIVMSIATVTVLALLLIVAVRSMARENHR